MATLLTPLVGSAVQTTSAAAAIGKINIYDATSGALTPPLPALSGLNVGARLAVRKAVTDTSANTVTVTCAGSDAFQSGGTSVVLKLSGEQRELSVISVSGTKFWAPNGTINPLAQLDSRYEAAIAAPASPTTKYLRGDKTFQTLNSTALSDSNATGRTLVAAATAGAGRDALNIGGLWWPADHGLIAWAYDPMNASSTQGLQSGNLFIIGLKVPVAKTVTNIITQIAVAGTSLTSGQNFAALYQGGTLLGATADQSTSWTSTGIKTMALTTPQNVAAGIVYAAFLYVGTGTAVSLNRSPNVGPVNVGLDATNYRWATVGGGGAYTAPPATISSPTAYGNPLWAAIS